MEKIVFKELIELFLHTSIYEFKKECEVPNINFKFGEDGFLLFQNIMENPFVLKDAWTPNIGQKDIDFLIFHSNDDTLTVQIEDSIQFFQYLTDITNSLIKLRNEYHDHSSSRNLAMQILRRIWLRMGIEDFQNVNYFLGKQLSFLINRTLDTLDIELVHELQEYKILKRTEVNPTWDESTRSMIFTIKNNESYYELPHILYDIDDNDICYIYAVQSSKHEKDKKIERELYKINKGIEDTNVHPSKVLSLFFFIRELEKKNITKIRIPSIQILSYHYHELLSKQAELDFQKAKINITRFPNSSYEKRQYDIQKSWHDRVYNKEDKISSLKTEELIHLAYRILEHYPDMQIVNDINLQGDYLDIRIKSFSSKKH